MAEFRTDTPTQFDLARWLYDRLSEIEGPPKSQMECLGRMTEIMTAVRPPKESKSS